MKANLQAKVDKAIVRLQSFCPEEGYFVAFSGGKDSIVVKHLCNLAGVKYDAHYSVTSVDPPELVYYIRQYHPDVSFDIPHDKDGKPVNMWNLIAKHTLPPTRKVRYCCEQLKECNGEGRVTVTGVRWAESPRRANTHGVVDFQNKPVGTRKMADAVGASYKLNKNGSVILNDDNAEERRLVEQCYRTRKTIVNPIVDWTDDDVWDFIHEYNLPYCKLYDEGFKRLGCIGCPLAGRKNMEKEFERWPKYKQLYIKAFQHMVDNHPGQIKILDPNYQSERTLDDEELELVKQGEGGGQPASGIGSETYFDGFRIFVHWLFLGAK